MYNLCGTGAPDVSGAELKKAFGVVQELIAARKLTAGRKLPPQPGVEEHAGRWEGSVYGTSR